MQGGLRRGGSPVVPLEPSLLVGTGGSPVVSELVLPLVSVAVAVSAGIGADEHPSRRASGMRITGRAAIMGWQRF
jgi:hypothetical protein